MGFGWDVPSPDCWFGLSGLPGVVFDCCIFNILLIKSPSRETGDRSDAKAAMPYLLEASLALSGSHDRSKHQLKEHRPGIRTGERVGRPTGQPRRDGDGRPTRDGIYHDRAAAAHRSRHITRVRGPPTLSHCMTKDGKCQEGQCVIGRGGARQQRL